MINLIPPSAKRSIALEYWKRVVGVWLGLFSLAFVMLSVFLLPTYIALNTQISLLEDTMTAGIDRVSNYDISAAELSLTNNLAKKLLDNSATNSYSGLITDLKISAGSAVLLNNFQFLKLDTTPIITVSGVADTRQGLANFRDVVASDTRIARVDLPISNLIKDRDLLFSMEITLATSTAI